MDRKVNTDSYRDDLERIRRLASGTHTIKQDGEFADWVAVLAKITSIADAMLKRHEPESDLAKALEILRSIEFTTVVASKCPVCLGWNAAGSGETPRTHTKNCQLAALLKRHPATGGGS